MVSISNDFSTTTNSYDNYRAYAREFARANKNDVANMAVLQYSVENQNKEKKFTKRINTAFNTLPVLAVASGLAAKRGMGASLASGATWGLALLAPDVIVGLNKKLTSVSPRIKEAEKKHPVMTFLGGVATSIGAFMGAVSLLDKTIAHPKVKGALSSAGEMLKDAGKAVKDSGFVAKTGAKLGELKAKVVGSKLVQPVINKFKNTEVLKNVAQGAKSLGKKALTVLPELAILGIGAALIGKSISTVHKINDNKKQIEEAQLQVANQVIDSYSAENEELKNIVYPKHDKDA